MLRTWGGSYGRLQGPHATRPWGTGSAHPGHVWVSAWQSPHAASNPLGRYCGQPGMCDSGRALPEQGFLHRRGVLSNRASAGSGALCGLGPPDTVTAAVRGAVSLGRSLPPGQCGLSGPGRFPFAAWDRTRPFAVRDRSSRVHTRHA